jgi:hypothetical protein
MIIKKKIAKYLIGRKWFRSLIWYLLPDDVEGYDAVMALRAEVMRLNHDENEVDINGWLMGVNWCKDYILRN